MTRRSSQLKVKIYNEQIRNNPTTKRPTLYMMTDDQTRLTLPNFSMGALPVCSQPRTDTVLTCTPYDRLNVEALKSDMARAPVIDVFRSHHSLAMLRLHTIVLSSFICVHRIRWRGPGQGTEGRTASFRHHFDALSASHHAVSSFLGVASVCRYVVMSVLYRVCLFKIMFRRCTDLYLQFLLSYFVG